MSDFIVIGIDPGSYRLGFAIMLHSKEEFFLLQSGVIEFEREDPLQNKLHFAFTYLSDLLSGYMLKYAEIYFAVETQFVHKNVHSSFQLMSFTAIVVLLSYRTLRSCLMLAPSEIKKIICGVGSASKNDLNSALSGLLGDKLPEVYAQDEYDAIAIAISGIRKVQMGPSFSEFKNLA